MCNRKKMTGRNVNPGLTEPFIIPIAMRIHDRIPHRCTAPLFATEPDHDDEAVDEFVEQRSGMKINVITGEILA